MWTTLFAFLSRIKIKHLLIISLVLLALLNIHLFNSLKKQKIDKQRIEQNYKELRDFDQSKIATLEFKNKYEFDSYLESKQEFKELLEKLRKENSIKVKQLNNVIYQQQIYIDTLKSTTNVTEIVKYIKQDVPYQKVWIDSSECLTITGEIVFRDGMLLNVVTSKEYNSKMILTGHWERPQRNWFTRMFGKRYATSTATSTCGETETIVINKKR